jgi:hypothetical protein
MFQLSYDTENTSFEEFYLTSQVLVFFAQLFRTSDQKDVIPDPLKILTYALAIFSRILPCSFTLN